MAVWDNSQLQEQIERDKLLRRYKDIAEHDKDVERPEHDGPNAEGLKELQEAVNKAMRDAAEARAAANAAKGKGKGKGEKSKGKGDGDGEGDDDRQWREILQESLTGVFVEAGFPNG
jgi:septal ring factor EnvC (AmiA/AmiB activator)